MVFDEDEAFIQRLIVVVLMVKENRILITLPPIFFEPRRSISETFRLQIVVGRC